MNALQRRFWVFVLFMLVIFKNAWAADHIAPGTKIHIAIRGSMIHSQLEQAGSKFILIVGDSIVESWLNPQFGDCQTINGGLGGGGT